MYTLDRRFLLKSIAASIGLAFSPFGIPSAPRALPIGKHQENFVLHNELPWALETIRSDFGLGPITPLSHFFVRNNLPMPSESILESRDEWTLAVEGCRDAGVLSLGELKTMRPHTVAAVLQCSGNGRAYFPHKPSGSQWHVGAAGCALWTGVRVADVFERFGGVSNKTKFLTGTGGESLPKGIDPSMVAVERSVPIDKGLEDCMLVWEMNGAPLPLAHGGPLRLLVPGYFGVNNVKWLTRLAATPQESSAKIQQSGYRLRGLGESGGPQHPSMWRMPVKSWLNGPGGQNQTVRVGSTTLYGVAFSGERGVEKVEVSGDGGNTWQPTNWVGPDLGPNAWRAFSLITELPAGLHSFVSRATDRAGEVQPEFATPNERGYGHNGWSDHAIQLAAVDELPRQSKTESVEMAPKPAPASTSVAESYSLSADAERGKGIFLNQAQPNCAVCHSLEAANASGAVGPNLDALKPDLSQIRAAVTQGVGAMPGYRGQLSDSEIDALTAFVYEATR